MSESSSPAPDSSLDVTSTHHNPRPPNRRRQARRPRPTVYSSVAGHETTQPRQSLPQSAVTAKSTAPADVLIERLGAPERYAEPQIDWYDAHRFLESNTTRRSDVYDDDTLQSGRYQCRSSRRDDVGGRESTRPKLGLRDDAAFQLAAMDRRQSTRLPDSDLCKAIHRYSSGFYSLLERGLEEHAEDGNDEADSVKRSFRSLDGTALLALGILLEESAASLMGAGSASEGEGWRALTTGLDGRSEEVPALLPRRRTGRRNRHDSPEESSDSVNKPSRNQHPAAIRREKKRKFSQEFK